jgi:hypothetical protein
MLARAPPNGHFVMKFEPAGLTFQNTAVCTVVNKMSQYCLGKSESKNYIPAKKYYVTAPRRFKKNLPI